MAVLPGYLSRLGQPRTSQREDRSSPDYCLSAEGQAKVIEVGYVPLP